MEATWSNMEKKEKIMWIKKAAEDQKRYEVSVFLFKKTKKKKTDPGENPRVWTVSES